METRGLDSGGFGSLLLTIVTGLTFGRWDVVECAVEPPVVPPVHPLRRGQLHVLEGPPGALAVDDLGLVQAVDRLGESVDAPIVVKLGRARNLGWEVIDRLRGRGIVSGSG